jgi:hypothetical protein
MNITGEQLSAHKNKLLNAAIVLLAVILAVYVNRGQSAKLEALQAKVASELQKNGVIRELALLQQDTGAYAAYFSPDDPGPIMTNFDSLTEGLNTEIVSVRPQKAQKEQGLSTIAFELNVRCKDYYSLSKFISAIENYQKVYVVDELVITPAEKGSLTGRLMVRAFAG